ncbi:hypothetical protein ACTXT7_016347 [Hymenolepis weldensis]
MYHLEQFYCQEFPKKEQIYARRHLPNQAKYSRRENDYEDLPEEQGSHVELYALSTCRTPEPRSIPYKNDWNCQTPKTRLSKKTTCPNAPLLEKSCSSRLSFDSDSEDTFIEN